MVIIIASGCNKCDEGVAQYLRKAWQKLKQSIIIIAFGSGSSLSLLPKQFHQIIIIIAS